MAQISVSGSGSYVSAPVFGDLTGPGAPVPTTNIVADGGTSGGQVWIANEEAGALHVSGNDSPAAQVRAQDGSGEELFNVTLPPSGGGPISADPTGEPGYVWIGQPGAGYAGVFFSQDQQAAQVVAGDGDGNQSVSYVFSPTDDFPTSSSASSSSSSDTITSGLGTDTVVTAGSATVAGADALASAVDAAAETLVGASAAESSSAPAGADSIGAVQANDFVSGDALPTLEPVSTDLAGADGGVSTVTLDDGLTTVELKGIDKPF